jgi:hypothetical protein
MKSIIYAIIAVFGLSLASCKKEDVKPANPTTSTNPATSLAVEYRVYAASGQVELSYKYPVNGVMVEKTEVINRIQHSISFNGTRGNELEIEAKNALPSTDEVKVELYVNGVLMASDITVSFNGKAKAEYTLN